MAFLRINKYLSMLVKQIGLTWYLVLLNMKIMEVLFVYGYVRVKHKKPFLLDQDQEKDAHYHHFCLVWN